VDYCMPIDKMMTYFQLIKTFQNNSRILCKCHFESCKLTMSSVQTTFFKKGI